MAVIRWVIGRFILLFDFIFSPSTPKLSAEQKTVLTNKTSHLSLYQLPACPFCVKVRRALKRQGLTLELRNINQNHKYKHELVEEGGKRTVPCLRIAEQDKPVQWLYESNDIIEYLKKITV